MRTRRLKALAGVAVLPLLFWGCAYNYQEKKQEIVVPGPVCDTSTRYAWANVEPIFQDQGCMGCHETQLPLLANKENFQVYITGNRSRFEDAINFRGTSPMPKGGSRMPDADIKKIEAWICQGMK